MERALKQRLVGAAVLVGLAVIFVPMLLDNSSVEESKIERTNIPPKPAEEFSSKIVPLEPVEPITPPPVPSNVPEDDASTSVAPATTEETPSTAAISPETSLAAPGPTDVTNTSDTMQRVGVNAWVVQLGSFASEQNAKDLESRLRKEGYAAFVEKLGSGTDQKYRVRVGPELVRAKAQEARDKLEKDLNLKGIVVRYP